MSTVLSKMMQSNFRLVTPKLSPKYMIIQLAVISQQHKNVHYFFVHLSKRLISIHQINMLINHPLPSQCIMHNVSHSTPREQMQHSFSCIMKLHLNTYTFCIYPFCLLRDNSGLHLTASLSWLIYVTWHEHTSHVPPELWGERCKEHAKATQRQPAGCD